MSTNKTPNYQLNQWEPTDQVLREEFNADNAKVDAALGGLSGQVAGKADQSVLNSLTTTVNGKASQSALNSLSSQVTTLMNKVSKLGNCQVEIQSYVGTRSYGDTTPTQITFKNSPDCFIICGGGRLIMGRKGVTSLLTVHSGEATTLQTSWSGNQLTIVGNSPVAQLNYKDLVYVVLGLHIMG